MDDNFVVYKPAEVSEVKLNIPLMEDPFDISDWASGVVVSEKGEEIPIVKNNISSEFDIRTPTQEYQLTVPQELVTVPLLTTTQQLPVQELSVVSKSSINGNLQNMALTLMNGLIERGCKPHEAAGIIGNLISESNLNLESINHNDVGLPAGGIALWRGANFSKLKLFAKNRGKSWKDLDILLDFLMSSINNDVKQRLSKSRNPSEASEAWAHYEKYAGYDGRLLTARSWLKQNRWSDERTMKWIESEHKNRSNNAEEIYKLWENSQKDK